MVMYKPNIYKNTFNQILDFSILYLCLKWSYLFRVLFDQSQPACVCHSPPVYVTAHIMYVTAHIMYVTPRLCMSKPACVCQSPACVCQSPVCVCQSPVDGHLVNPHQYP